MSETSQTLKLASLKEKKEEIFPYFNKSRQIFSYDEIAVLGTFFL